MKIKKDDMVIVLTGKDKGTKGKVLHAFHTIDKVTVEGVAVKKKHTKSRRGSGKGQIIEKAMPIHVSNVALLDPKSGKATRVGSKVIAGKTVRISKKSGTEV